MVNEKPIGHIANTLPKFLTPLETLCFGLASHITWLIGAPIIIHNLGFSSMYIWIIGSIISVLSLVQVRYIARQNLTVSGGVGSYIAGLFPENSFITKYASIAYFLGWAAIPAASTMLLSVFITHIFTFDIDSIFSRLLQIFFIILISSIGLSSNKLLSIFHAILTLPIVLSTVILTLIASVYLLATNSGEIVNIQLIGTIPPTDFFKYFFLGAIIFYSGDIATSFTPDSTNPNKTINNTRWLVLFLPIIYILSSWILTILGAGDTSIDIYNFTSLISNNFFGSIGLFFTTLWVVSSLLLACATVIAHAPRIIYQLSLDKKISPIFSIVSRRGSLKFATIFSIIISICFLFFDNIETLVIVASTPYFLSYIIFHIGVLFKKGAKPRIITISSFILVPFEIICFIIGVLNLNPWLIFIGFISPIVLMILDNIIPPISNLARPKLKFFFETIPVFQSVDNSIIIFTQLLMLIVIEVVTILSTWFIVLFLNQQPIFYKIDYLAFILVISCFTTIAIAASTVFSQIQNLEDTTKNLAEVNQILEHDIQRRIIAENALVTISTHDELTKLGNRKLLAGDIKKALKKIKNHKVDTFGLLIINLNRFKSINDSLGNKIGDELLKNVANRLKTTQDVSKNIYRLGSDEFAIMLINDVNKELVTQLVQNILTSFTYPYLIKSKQLYITASIGVNIVNDESQTVDGVMSETNIALLEAKKMGKNRFSFFDKDQYERVINLLDLETKLPKAIKNKEFELFYQPIINLKTNKISGYETLVRWASGDKKLLPPSSFIPMAEETDLVVPLTWQILERACLDIRKIQKKFNNDYLRINVNFSLKQFFEPDLVQKIIEITKKAEIPVSCLKIEITESMLQDSEDLILVMNQLSDNDIKLNLDDFGTGYSSLGYLNTLPISALKIDKSFIRSLNPKSLEITQAMINLAANIGAWTIVEGIETKQQLIVVKDMGANFGQGFYFGRPMPLSSALNFIYPNDQPN